MRKLYRKIMRKKDGPWTEAKQGELRQLRKLEKAGYVTVVYGDDMPLVVLPTKDGDIWYSEGPLRAIKALGRGVIRLVQGIN